MQRPGEVRHHHDGAFEYAHQEEVTAGVIGVDPGGELADPLLQLFRRDQHVFQVTGYVRGVHDSLPVTKRSLPYRRSHRRSPGRSVARWPCQSVTKASIAATCAAVSAPDGAPASIATRRSSLVLIATGSAPSL